MIFLHLILISPYLLQLSFCSDECRHRLAVSLSLPSSITLQPKLYIRIPLGSTKVHISCYAVHATFSILHQSSRLKTAWIFRVDFSELRNTRFLTRVGQPEWDDIKILGCCSVSVCLYVCLCVLSGTGAVPCSSVCVKLSSKWKLASPKELLGQL